MNGIVPTDPMIRRKYGFDNIDWIELSKYYWSKYCEIHDGIDLYHYEKVSHHIRIQINIEYWTRWFDQIKFLENQRTLITKKCTQLMKYIDKFERMS